MKLYRNVDFETVKSDPKDVFKGSRLLLTRPKGPLEEYFSKFVIGAENLHRSIREVTTIDQNNVQDSQNDEDGDRISSLLPVQMNSLDENKSSQHSSAQRTQNLPFAKIPNFFQAILTLAICGLLLATCLLIIRRAQVWCKNRSRSKKKDGESGSVEATEANNENENRNGNGSTKVENHIQSNNENNSNSNATAIIVEDEPSSSSGNTPGILVSGRDSDWERDRDRHDSNRSSTKGEESTSGLNTSAEEPRPHSSCSTSSKKKSPRITFVRRESGPFGEEALAYVEQTYQKVKSKNELEKHPYEQKESSWARRASSKRIRKGANDPKRRSVPIPTITIDRAVSQEMLDESSSPTPSPSPTPTPTTSPGK